MTTQEIENGIVEKLRSEILKEEADVLAFPDDACGFLPKHPVGAALVQYTSSSFAEPRTLGSCPISQTRDMRFKVFVLRRNLRDHAGVYPALDAVRGSLSGFALEGTSRMYQLSEKFLSEQNGIWIYEMVFSLRMVYEAPEPRDLE